MEYMNVTSPEMLNVREEVKEKLASYRYAVNRPNVNMETVVAEYDKMASVYAEVSHRIFFVVGWQNFICCPQSVFLLERRVFCYIHM